MQYVLKIFHNLFLIFMPTASRLSLFEIMRFNKRYFLKIIKIIAFLENHDIIMIINPGPPEKSRENRVKNKNKIS